MPFIVGMVLTPVGAFVATLAFETGVSAAHGMLGSSLLSTDMLSVFAVVWLSYGLAYTAPVTMIVLPLVYARLRRRSALTTTRIMVAGVSAAVVLMWVFIGVSELLSEKREFRPDRIAGFSMMGVLTGLAVGAAFAYIMRWKQPADWSAKTGAIAPSLVG